MNRRARLCRVEAELWETVRRLTGVVVERLRRELTVAERRAFCRVAERTAALRRSGVPCPSLPTEADVEQIGTEVRLRSGGVAIASAEEWPLYRKVARRIRALWEELDGPNIGWENA